MNTFLVVLPLLAIIAVLLIKCSRHSNRLKEIRRVINTMSRGDFSSRMVLSPSDKLSSVALQINELSQGIQKRLQEITDEKEKLEAILSSMAEGVLVISSQEKLVHLSPSFLDMFDVRSLDWPGKHYWEIIRNPAVNEPIREALVNKKIIRKEIQLVHPQEMFFNLQISPILNSKGVLISLVAILHDVTELKKYERLRTEFVANVSHELKTPLTSIKGFVETLQNGAIDDKKSAQHFLGIISKQAQRLENLVNDLLVISSLESKDVQLNFTFESVGSVIHSVLLMKKQQMEEFGHDLILDIPSNLPMIRMDTQRMEQVFLNLLDNAIKYTHREGKIQIKGLVEGGYLRVDVIDNGPGISSENLSRIFERFFREDRSRSQEKGGTGLGLSIVKHIVDAHGGKVNVDSALGKGTRFSVFLPINMV
jgi:two-component system phosphate regulon sensor histidine kinase PhoR